MHSTDQHRENNRTTAFERTAALAGVGGGGGGGT